MTMLVFARRPLSVLQLEIGVRVRVGRVNLTVRGARDLAVCIVITSR